MARGGSRDAGASYGTVPRRTFGPRPPWDRGKGLFHGARTIPLPLRGRLVNARSLPRVPLRSTRGCMPRPRGGRRDGAQRSKLSRGREGGREWARFPDEPAFQQVQIVEHVHICPMGSGGGPDAIRRSY